MEILYLPFHIFLIFPYLAFLVAVPFFAFWYFYHRKVRIRSDCPKGIVLLTAGFIWVIYGIYEIFMYSWSKSVIATIRIDLLLIVPVLYVISLVGMWGAWRSYRTMKNINATSKTD
jgi:hypothetical protein